MHAVINSGDDPEHVNVPYSPKIFDFVFGYGLKVQIHPSLPGNSTIPTSGAKMAKFPP